ncbi:unnamed protein product [Periconia digitata]|uniref:Uncharacterized protein n=1 Tax=Periconia digitata TaxID=1303443 RepID=A0A9W4UHV6_9PLEO|nr:unnamed protein product [Periconia digitata]
MLYSSLGSSTVWNIFGHHAPGRYRTSFPYGDAWQNNLAYHDVVSCLKNGWQLIHGHSTSNYALAHLPHYHLSNSRYR